MTEKLSEKQNIWDMESADNLLVSNLQTYTAHLYIGYKCAVYVWRFETNNLHACMLQHYIK